MAELAAAGFKTVINNRPNGEVPAELHSDTMRQAAEDAGLVYIENPVINGAMTMDMVSAQRAAIENSQGPVFAWCRSGTRSAIVWSLAQAGTRGSAEIVDLVSKAGYDIPGMIPQLDALADQRSD